jgi:hypothetical protein
MHEELDLWGDPIPPRPERRGRPSHEATEEKRLRVKALAAVNKTHTEIAHAMGISEPTLRRYYLRELRGGLAQLRAAVMVKLVEKALGGDVGAMKEFLRQTERADLARTPLPARPVRPAALGKKEIADRAAAEPDPTTDIGALLAEREGQSLN